MFEVHIACSGRGCPEELDLVVAELDELYGLGCDCGYGFVLLSVSEVELLPPGGAEVIRLRDDDVQLAA